LHAEGRIVCSPVSNGAAAAFRAPSLVATFLGALEIVLDRALNDDRFASSFIVEVAVVCALASVLMIPRRPPAVIPLLTCGWRRRASSAPVFSDDAGDRRHPAVSCIASGATGCGPTPR
jgi:hypothetical protein